jgi:hypothetical protein
MAVRSIWIQSPLNAVGYVMWLRPILITLKRERLITGLRNELNKEEVTEINLPM